MTTQNPLQILQAFSPSAQGITNAAQAGTNILTSGLQQDLLRSQTQGVDFANQQAIDSQAASQSKLASDANIQNTANNLLRLNTALDQGANPEQIATLLQQNISRAQQQGGDGADSRDPRGGMGRLPQQARPRRPRRRTRG